MDDPTTGDTVTDLPRPYPLRRALYIHFWWGSQEFRMLASAAAVRPAYCPMSGRTLTWLQCLAIAVQQLRPDGGGSVTHYLIPAEYVTEARPAGTFRIARPRVSGDRGIFPATQPPPVIAVPLDELERVVADLIDPTLN